MSAATAARRALLVGGLPLALLVLWWLVSNDSQSVYLPPLRDILRAFADTWLGPRLVDDVLPSVVRLLAGFAVATLVGVGLGVAIGSSPRLRATLEPVLEFLRAIPPPVLVPIFILVAGIGTTMKVLVIVSGCLWPILLNTVEGCGPATSCWRTPAAPTASAAPPASATWCCGRPARRSSPGCARRCRSASS